MFFQYDNTEQVLYKQPTYPNEMRQHFDTYQFKKIVDFKNKDWDFVYCYLGTYITDRKSF